MSRGCGRLPPRGHPAPARDQSGAALLLVAAATAALVVPATVLMLLAAAAYEAAGYRADLAQAEAFARATLLQAEHALATGELPAPGPGRPVRVRNGALQEGGTAPVGVFPRPPVAGWPVPTEAPPGALGGVTALGAELQLELVLGPDGDPRSRTRQPDGGLLIDAAARAWFRRAVVQDRARLLLLEGSVSRID